MFFYSKNTEISHRFREGNVKKTKKLKMQYLGL